MSRTRWHILSTEDAVTLARHLPVRFDVEATTVLPDGSRRRVAHQVRQDMWRALQRQRGFSPVVEVRRVAGGLTVRAGGRIAGPFDAARVAQQIQAVLDRPESRARWVNYARAGR